jgi:hypothetical protein
VAVPASAPGLIRAPAPAGSVAERAEIFCRTAPHRRDPFSRRNWGGTLHSLCSYQGKLKPGIAHFLVSWFTEPGDTVLDPMAGIGTIPFESRRQGRVALGNDLSPLAAVVTRAKLEPVLPPAVRQIIGELTQYVAAGPPLSVLEGWTDVSFGLNGPIRDYFHPKTLREVLLARAFFLSEAVPSTAADVVKSNILHILHGNRPYALSRRSHPVTPFAPSGEFEYRPLIRQLTIRLDRVLPELVALGTQAPAGKGYEEDFRSLKLGRQVDAVITSPPFASSLRFWTSNWMRLWFAGWEPADFKSEPGRYLETQQRFSFAPYADLGSAMAELVRPGGIFVLHLGETARVNMADQVAPFLDPWFETIYAGREDVGDTESHGLRDKGATTAHWYLFTRRRAARSR